MGQDQAVVATPDVQSPAASTNPSPTLTSGLSRLGEILRQLRKASGGDAVDQLTGEMASVLAELARTQNCEVACPDLLLQVMLLGKALVQEGRLALWVQILQRLAQHATQKHDLSATRLDLDLVQRIGSQEALQRVVERCAQPDAAQLKAFEDYVALLPATSLAAVARVAIGCVNADLRVRLDAFAHEAARNHPAGLRELISDPDERLSLYALDLLTPVAPKSRAPMAALAFNHASPNVRIVAARHLGDVADDDCVRRLVQRAGERAFRMRSTEEQLEVYVALARTQHSIALARVEERLTSRTGGLAAKVTALIKRPTADPIATAIIDHLAGANSPVTRDLLARGARAPDPAIARACKRALETAKDGDSSKRG